LDVLQYCEDGTCLDVLQYCEDGTCLDVLQYSEDGTCLDVLQYCEDGTCLDVLQYCEDGTCFLRFSDWAHNNGGIIYTIRLLCLMLSDISFTSFTKIRMIDHKLLDLGENG
jgi:hypothetical protein